MATMGDLLGAARRSTAGFQAWLEQSDPQMAGQVAQAAAAMGTPVSTFLRIAVADFSRFATEEDWATAISSMRDASDPGTICLLAMLDWRLNTPACENHSLPQQPWKGSVDVPAHPTRAG